jgi:hypothetical protein|tara:strand:+ start:310 stop:564 length:255 start_codon:yes stop_codon:yes gene_type:complete
MDFVGNGPAWSTCLISFSLIQFKYRLISELLLRLEQLGDTAINPKPTLPFPQYMVFSIIAASTQASGGNRPQNIATHTKQHSHR